MDKVEMFDGLINLLRNDGSILVNKNLAFELGIDATIMFTELVSKYMYFRDREQLDEEGMFFNTIDNFEEDTTLKEKVQRKAIKKLEELGLIKVKLKGLPKKRYFNINKNTNLLLKLINAGGKKREEKRQNNIEKSMKAQTCQKGGTVTVKKAELYKPKRTTNNTKGNNPKPNNTNPYTISKKQETVSVLLQIENLEESIKNVAFNINSRRKKISEDNYYIVSTGIDWLEEKGYNIDEIVYDYLDTVPKIPSIEHFMKVIPRLIEEGTEFYNDVLRG